MDNYYVRMIELPINVKGVTVKNSDGSFDVYLNSLLCPEKVQEALIHEQNHVIKDHLYNDIKSIEAVEYEAII